MRTIVITSELSFSTTIMKNCTFYIFDIMQQILFRYFKMRQLIRKEAHWLKSRRWEYNSRSLLK